MPFYIVSLLACCAAIL